MEEVDDAVISCFLSLSFVYLYIIIIIIVCVCVQCKILHLIKYGQIKFTLVYIQLIHIYCTFSLII